MILNTNDCFELIKIISKMGIKRDLIDIIKKVIVANSKLQNTQRKLLEIAEKKYKGDNKKAVENNVELGELYYNLEAELNSYLVEVVFLVVEGMPRAEKEVKGIVAKVNNITIEEVESMEADVFLTKVKEIVSNETFQRFFSSTLM